MTTTPNPIVFLDTETTGLHLDRRPWEIALIRREPGIEDKPRTFFVADVDLASAELIGLKIGGFFDRHPIHRTAYPAPSPPNHVRLGSPIQIEAAAFLAYEADVAIAVERITRGATIIGAVPSFDTETLAAMLRRHQLAPSWHYQPVDVEAMALGYRARQRREPIEFPVRSDDLSAELDIAPPPEDLRHTAMGDADWVRRWYDRMIYDEGFGE